MKLLKGILTLALVLTVVSSVTILPTNQNDKGTVSTQGVPDGWLEWGVY